jgi:predicted nucleotidyltransferase component of viral defense system
LGWKGGSAMIDRAEILQLAGELGLRPDVVEKDYVLGWLLAGIARDEVLGASWVFKGGTCLKKCFFETYRFSEDLDFTITNAAQLDRDFLIERFKTIGEWLYDETGIELPADLLRFDVYDTKRGSRAGQGRIAYRGPMARGGDLPRVKLDLTADEVLIMPAILRPVAHPYSDAPEDGIEARCYTFEEVFGEKVRALGERSRPRDLYDVINLFRNGDFPAAAAAIRDVVQRKCAFKGIAVPTLESLNPFREELFGEWKNMLGHQLPALPPIDSFFGALPEFFSWLAGEQEPVVLAAHPMARNTEVIRGPAGAIGFIGERTSFIEIIRFAASNRLCVDLEYRDEQDRRGTRTIEAYSLRRTQAGDTLLMAVRADNGQPRSYRLDRIESARVTERSFTPRYPVELTPTGPLSTSYKERGSSGGGSWGGFSGGMARATRAPRVPRTPRSGGTYIFRCMVCGKQFERQSYDSTLRPHKNRSGWDCYGRTGIYVRTKS